jgi:hypothetical protein
MHTSLRRVTFLLVLLAAAPFVAAQPILSNYPPTNDTNTTADVDNLRQKALSFSMPASQSATVGNLTVRLGNYAVATDLPIFEIRDHTGSTTAPGPNVLLSFTAPPPGGAAIQDYTFTPSSTFTLAAGTSYWILMRGADAVTSVDWRGSSPAIVPTGIATYGGQSLFTTNGGTSWTTSATINSLHLEVIPEPSMLGLAGVGFVALGARARRTRRAA